MVERDLAKVKTRVRFPSPAPTHQPPEGGFFYGISAVKITGSIWKMPGLAKLAEK